MGSEMCIRDSSKPLYEVDPRELGCYLHLALLQLDRLGETWVSAPARLRIVHVERHELVRLWLKLEAHAAFPQVIVMHIGILFHFERARIAAAMLTDVGPPRVRLGRAAEQPLQHAPPHAWTAHGAVCRWRYSAESRRECCCPRLHETRVQRDPFATASSGMIPRQSVYFNPSASASQVQSVQACTAGLQRCSETVRGGWADA